MLVKWALFLALPLFCECKHLSSWVESTQALLSNPSASVEGTVLTVESSWQTLGPFRIGTREATWGADPLERLGGFSQLQYDANATFASSLGRNAKVTWQHDHFEPLSTLQDDGASSVEVHIDVHFPNIDWNFMQTVYGWPALQYQAWIRGTFWISGNESKRLHFYTPGTLEFSIDGRRYFGGDFYSFERVPLSENFAPGSHQIELRLIRDVRAMAGNDAAIQTQLKIVAVSDTPDAQNHIISFGHSIVPDIISGRNSWMCQPSSIYASIDIRNEADVNLEINHVKISRDVCDANMVTKESILLRAGQTRPMAFTLGNCDCNVGEIALLVTYTNPMGTRTVMQSSEIRLIRRNLLEPHKVTFLNPSGVVSHYVLQPPAGYRHNNASINMPVLLALHGAGVEVDSDMARHSFDEAADLEAWLVLPSGGSPWSADDWHIWGSADAEAAITSILSWIEHTGWAGSGVDVDRWLVAGHSNGGQGTWSMLTHKPDKIIAAAPLSGYTSIQNYVPYSMWSEIHPMLTAVLQNSLIDYKHELLLENAVGIPILLQHGSADDNVPPYHSRLMSELLTELDTPSGYHELLDMPHWFEGTMTTAPLQDLYMKYLLDQTARNSSSVGLEAVFTDSDELDSVGGIVVDQLLSPEHLGRVSVKVLSAKHLHLKTTNVRRFHLDPASPRMRHITTISLDSSFCPAIFQFEVRLSSSFVLTADSDWIEGHTDSWKSIDQRSGRQRGSMRAILRSTGPFEILTSSSDNSDLQKSIALAIGRNFLQYYGADSIINPLAPGKSCNRVVLAVGPEMSASALTTYPFSFYHSHLSIKTPLRARPIKIPYKPGMSAVFLRPLPDERLELVAWGTDEDGLRQAARLVPMLTGVGQPDFVVMNADARWKGTGGIVAAGFFDYRWKVSAGAFLPFSG